MISIIAGFKVVGNVSEVIKWNLVGGRLTTAVVVGIITAGEFLLETLILSYFIPGEGILYSTGIYLTLSVGSVTGITAFYG